MRDTKSIFFKYFVICAAVILISFICLGAVLLLVSSQYFAGEKKALLMKNAKDSVVEINDAVLSGSSISSNDVMTILKSHAQSTKSTFFIVDTSGRIILSTETDSRSIPDSILEETGEEGTYFKSTLNGYYSSEYHVVGIRFFVKDSNVYLFASSPISEQESYIWNVMELFLLSMVFVLVVVLVIVYVATLRLTAPMKQMAAAAKKIGNGNFAGKLPEYDITEFQQLGDAFNEMSASLNNYDKMRSSFVANVSHELRTPMTSIGGFVDGILDGTIPPSEQKKYLRVISSEVQRLTRLVRSMLNLAKIESGSMNLNSTTFSIIEPIVDTLVTFESRIDDKHLDIRGLDVDRVLIYADNDLVHQVIYNLIENAIKFVNDGGYIEFGFNVHEKMTGISIINSGDGLDEEDLPLVFDRFYKTDESRGKDQSGVGLGLNIVRSIVKLHGGNIMVRSVKHEYTEFIFTLPNKPTETKGE